MPRSATQHSTRRLSEVARHVVIPDGIVTTAWPRVVAQCAEMGVTFEGWQDGAGRVILGKRADGKYAATVGGVVLSIGRQVGKTFLVGMIVVALCVLHPGLTVLWSAHRTRTATKTFGSLKGLTSRKRIAPFMLEPRNANGEQEIRFKNGSVIMFGAREQGFGRGFDEVDIEVFDEAQILTEKALEDMVAATNQSRHEAGALLFFMGTPPRDGDYGDEFTNRRVKALSGKSRNMVYIEFSADEDADLDDHGQWAKANPSFPHFTPVESMERMRENLTDDDSFRREALGIWDTTLVKTVIPLQAWRDSVVDPMVSRIVGPPVFAVEIPLDRSMTAIGVAGHREDGSTQFELVSYMRGTGRALDELVRLAREHGGSVAVDGQSPAASLVPALQDAGVQVLVTSASDMARACGAAFDGITEGGYYHLGDPILERVLVSAVKRPLLSGWALDRKSGDISPLVAVILAAYVLELSMAQHGGGWMVGL